MQNTLNRRYSLVEKQGLGYVSTIVAHGCEENLKVIVQIEIAGNNAHDFKDDQFVLGKTSEPIMCHSHTILRGFPEHVYLPSILPGRKLGGPRPGQMFNMRGDVKEPGPGGDVGNMSKGKWSSGEIKVFATYLESCLRPFILESADLEFISPTLE